MKTTTDFVQLPGEDSGVLVSASVAGGGGQFGAVATVISLPEKEGSLHPTRTVRADAHKSRGIPELDSPMAG